MTLQDCKTVSDINTFAKKKRSETTDYEYNGHWKPLIATQLKHIAKSLILENEQQVYNEWLKTKRKSK